MLGYVRTFLLHASALEHNLFSCDGCLYAVGKGRNVSILVPHLVKSVPNPCLKLCIIVIGLNKQRLYCL